MKKKPIKSLGNYLILRDLWKGIDIDYIETPSLESLLSITYYKYQAPIHMLFDRRDDMILVPKVVIESGIHFYVSPYSEYVNNEECIFNSTGDLIIGNVIIDTLPGNIYDRYYEYIKTGDLSVLHREYI